MGKWCGRKVGRKEIDEEEREGEKPPTPLDRSLVE